MRTGFRTILILCLGVVLGMGTVTLAGNGPGGPSDCPDHDGDGICNGQDPDYVPGTCCPNPECPNPECPNPDCPGPNGPKGPKGPKGTPVVTLLAACCFDDASCLNLPRADCFAAGGWPHKVGTYCSAIHCEGPRPVPCCLPDGSCEELQPRICNRQDGHPFYGYGSCEDVACP